MVDAKAIKDKVSKKINSARSKISVNNVPHKHCRMCGITIPVNSEKRLCNEDDCIASHEKEEKTRGRLRIWLMVFGSFFILTLIAPIMGNVI